jgi:deoxyribose-phosphate aldolase
MGELIMEPKIVARAIDHTILKPDAVSADVIKLCDEAMAYGFAAVCINPAFVPLAAGKLVGTDVMVCTVVGFPLGVNRSDTKAAEARLAVLEGAREIDMVIWVGALKEKNYDVVEKDIAQVVKAVREANERAIVKVIIEACLLTDEEKVLACQLAESAGAHFVKTSTGFSRGGATLNDVRLMRATVGSRVNVKASGGIRTAVQAVEFIRASAARLGTSSGVSIIEELTKLQFGQRSKAAIGSREINSENGMNS